MQNKQSQIWFEWSTGQLQQQLHAPQDSHSHNKPPPSIQLLQYKSVAGMIRTQLGHGQTIHVCTCHSPSRVLMVSVLSQLAASSICEPGGEGGADGSGAGGDCEADGGSALNKLEPQAQQQLHAPHLVQAHKSPRPSTHFEHHDAPTAMATLQCVHSHVVHGDGLPVPSLSSAVLASLSLPKGDEGGDCVCPSSSRVSTVSLRSQLAASFIGELGGEGGLDGGGEDKVDLAIRDRFDSTIDRSSGK